MALLHIRNSIDSASARIIPSVASLKIVLNLSSDSASAVVYVFLEIKGLLVFFNLMHKNKNPDLVPDLQVKSGFQKIASLPYIHNLLDYR